MEPSLKVVKEAQPAVVDAAWKAYSTAQDDLSKIRQRLTKTREDLKKLQLSSGSQKIETNPDPRILRTRRKVEDIWIDFFRLLDTRLLDQVDHRTFNTLLLELISSYE